MNYYERHIGDYLKDTAHLSLLEHGVYTRLLDIYYTREGGFTTQEAVRLIGARSREDKAALQSVLGEFFELADGLYVQARAEREIAKLGDKRRKASASAAVRWGAVRSKSERNATASETHMRTATESNANAMPTQCEGNARAPVPSLQSPDTNKPPTLRVAPPLPKSAKGARLPSDWEPDPPGVAFAEAQGLRNGRASTELAKFRDYWAAQPGQKGVKTDWPATWRNWCRRAAEAPMTPAAALTTTVQSEAAERTKAYMRDQFRPLTPEEKTKADEARKRAVAGIRGDRA